MKTKIETKIPLKKCPFCGGDASIRQFVGVYIDDKCNQFSVGCSENSLCKAAAFVSECGPYFDNDQANRGFPTDEEALDTAIKNWNTRAGDEDV